MVEYLEQLVQQWYEYQGYFVREDLWVGFQPDGSYECELDVVAFHPTRRRVMHVETGYDLPGLTDQELHFRTKFDAGKKYLHRMFGAADHLHIEQTALLLQNEDPQRHTVGGGRILLLTDFLAEILQSLSGVDVSSATVPAQWPLILTLQFIGELRRGPPAEADSQFAADGKSPRMSLAKE